MGYSQREIACLGRVAPSTVRQFAAAPGQRAVQPTIAIAYTQSSRDQRFLILAGWGFIASFVWGFSSRWLPIFLGLATPSAFYYRFLYWWTQERQ